ncbi:MAG: Rieske (2Fe-2S) protein [Nevskiales bacterium]
MPWRKANLLCRLEDLPDPGSARFAFAGDSHGHGLCVLRRGDQVFGYLNRCPHTGGPLDWVPGQFLSADQGLIQCSTHGAQFRIEDGYCVAGPCAGASLTPVPIRVRSGRVELLEQTGA